MNPFDIRTLLSLTWETSAFPAEECVVADFRESGILNSPITYVVFITDPRGGYGRIELARPYTCRSLHPNGAHLYGWASATSDEWFDHWERSVHNDDARVVAWAPVPHDFRLVPRNTVFPDTED
jgi:hypothetical protein